MPQKQFEKRQCTSQCQFYSVKIVHCIMIRDTICHCGHHGTVAYTAIRSKLHSSKRETSDLN